MNGWNDWDRVVIDGMAGAGRLPLRCTSTPAATTTGRTCSSRTRPSARSGPPAALIERAAYAQKLAKPPRIAYDEWNVWYRTMTAALEERYTLADALAVATYLNIFIRNCAWVRMANLAQMVNAIAPIVTTPDGAVVQPIYYPLLLHARAALDLAVDVHVNGATVGPELPPARAAGRTTSPTSARSP